MDAITRQGRRHRVEGGANDNYNDVGFGFDGCYCCC